MYKLKNVLLLSLSLVSINFYCFAQKDSTFLGRAVKLCERQPAVEKVYLHLDRSGYGFTDTIWYKAYTVIGIHHQLSALSAVLYVELISPEDSLIARQTLHLRSGLAWGNIPLLPTLKQGSYRIRGYTRWMRNAGAGYFYNQKISIGGISNETKKQTGPVNPDVQFFPEGGSLINGIRSRVAVKAVNANGTGEDIKGAIEDNEGNIVAEFTTKHLGMGMFALLPQSGKTYKAKLYGKGGTSFIVDFPSAQEEGYTLALNTNLPDSITVKVAVNGKVFLKQKNNSFYVTAQTGGKVYYTTQGKLQGLVYTAKVDRSRFPSGILQFTLFSQSGEPLAERIAFVQNNDTLKLKTIAPSKNFTARQQVRIGLNAADNNNQPVTGSFSVSVINESSEGENETGESTIFNNLLLRSDLKGTIEQPNYYFLNPNSQTRADLDLLMLTQGYRRFEWKQVLSDAIPAITYQPETSLVLEGTLKTPSGKPIPNGKVTLMAVKANLIKDTVGDINGNFKFNNLDLTDTVNLVLRARKENKGSNVMIAVKSPTYPSLDDKNNTATGYGQTSEQPVATMQKNYTKYLLDQKAALTKNGIQLKQVTIKGYKRPIAPDLSRSSNLHRGGGADQVIMGDKLGPCADLSDCLIGKVFGVKFLLSGKPVNWRGGNMSLIVDGNIIDGSYLNDINSNEIYSIEVLRSNFAKAIYGSSIESGGALIITLKRGTEGNAHLKNTSPSGIITCPFFGYSKRKVFYLPKYIAKGDTQLLMEHNTIYWNPNIITDKQGKASFVYYNNDNKGTYRVVVEGIDDNGNLGRQVYRYKVE